MRATAFRFWARRLSAPGTMRAAAIAFAASLLAAFTLAGNASAESRKTASATTVQRPPALFDRHLRFDRPESLLQELLNLQTAVQTAPAEEALDTTPQLRLELGQHIGTISAIDVDSTGHLLVTGGLDKTARIWKAPREPGEHFRLLKVLRLPIKADPEGRVYAVAMSPRADLVAVAGYTGARGDRSVYIFRSSTGSAIKRLGGLREVITSLAFSPDGKWLAVGLGSKRGLKVYPIRECLDESGASACEPASDPNYGGTILGLSFARDSRLATTSLDGRIRLYAPGAFSAPRIPPIYTEVGKDPVGIAFAPDKTQDGLAVAYGSTKRVGQYWANFVSVLSSATLEAKAHFFQTYNGDVGGYTRVAWDSDGTVLYTAGNVSTPTVDRAEYLIQVIQRQVQELEGSQFHPMVGPGILSGSVRPMTDLKPLRDGGIAFASSDPQLGILRRGAPTTEVRGPATIDGHVTKGQAQTDSHTLRMSRDGRSISFAFDTFKEDFFTFSADTRTLVTLTGEDENLSKPTQLSKPIMADVFARIEASLRRGENPTALAQTVDGKLVLGSQWHVRLYDRNGNQVCQHRAPSNTWALNISEETGEGQQRLIVGAFGDGTFRWYRTSDCAELLALYVTPSPRQTEWVAWIPEGPHRGYFATSSVEADVFLGWHVNRNIDREALFYSLGQLYDQYQSYRPDVISRVLTTLDTGKALNEAAQAAGRPATTTSTVSTNLPPVVRILEPADGAELVANYARLRYVIETPSVQRGPVTKIVVLVNGRDRTPELAGLKAGEPQTVFVEGLPAGESLLSVIASDAHGGSEPASVRIKVVAKLEKERPPSDIGVPSQNLAPRHLLQIPPSGPRLTILEPCNEFSASVDYVRLRFKIEPVPAAVPTLTMLVNQSPHKDWTPLSTTSQGEYATFVQNLPPGDVTMTLIAQTASSTSMPASVVGKTNASLSRMSECGSAALPDTPATIHVLAVGVSNYQDPALPPLDYAAKDAQQFYNHMKRLPNFKSATSGGPLLNERATRRNLEDALIGLKDAGPSDTVLIFLSGHGAKDRTGEYYYMTREATLRDPHLGMSRQTLLNHIGHMPRTRILFIDTCRGGQALSGSTGVDVTPVLSDLRKDMVVFSASSGTNFSYEYGPPIAHGLFTFALLEGIKPGGADGLMPSRPVRDGLIQMDELREWLKKRVPEIIAAQRRNDIQIPVVYGPQIVPEEREIVKVLQ